jgi:hypothetical protein
MRACLLGGSSALRSGWNVVATPNGRAETMSGSQAWSTCDVPWSQRLAQVAQLVVGLYNLLYRWRLRN